MGGSTADTPASPEFLRASDAERDHAVSELRNEFAEGRLSHETFMYRMQSALDARNRGQLAGLFTDLPPRRSGPKKLLTRIRAALRGEDPAARDRRPEEDPGAPGTERIVGSPHGPASQARAWMQRHQGNHEDPAVLPPVAADPVPLVFPPGRGVRFTIGRTRDCDLCLTDLSVSRMHALLVRREDGWVLSDLGSHNGTRLNGWLVREPVPVQAGDRVEFGSMAFIIQGDAPAEPAAPEEEPRSLGTGPSRYGTFRVKAWNRLESGSVTTVLLVRHGLTATTGHVLTGWTPGIPLDDRGQAQAATLAARLAPLPLDAIVSSPLERCQQTAAAIAATRDGQQIITEERVGECHYGDWTGKPLKKLAQEQLWRVVQAHPSAVTFPGPDGESMPDMQHRAVAAVREWNARLGQDATYLVCSHGDVIKAIVADSLGLHLDQCQRIQADPCSLTVIRYTPLRPFLVRMNDRGGGVDDLMPRADGHGHARSRGAASSDGAVGGGSGGPDGFDGSAGADPVNGATSIRAGAAASSGQQPADTRG